MHDGRIPPSRNAVASSGFVGYFTHFAPTAIR